jgi:hypothetical protein
VRDGPLSYARSKCTVPGSVELGDATFQARQSQQQQWAVVPGRTGRDNVERQPHTFD